jgi:hypothetical protein
MQLRCDVAGYQSRPLRDPASQQWRYGDIVLLQDRKCEPGAEARYGWNLSDPFVGHLHAPVVKFWPDLSADWPEIARRPTFSLLNPLAKSRRGVNAYQLRTATGCPAERHEKWQGENSPQARSSKGFRRLTRSPRMANPWLWRSVRRACSRWNTISGEAITLG